MAGTPSREAERAASRLERTRPFRIAARAGYAIAGLLHVIIGVLAISIGLHAHGQNADQTGALRSVAAAPGGLLLLVLMIAGLLALGVWQILRSITAEQRDEKVKWRTRMAAWGQAVGYLFLAGLGISVVVGGGSTSGGTPLTARVLSVPGGVVLVVAVGLGVFAGGVWFVVKGVTRKFLDDLRPGRLRGAVETVGVGGHVAEGLALAVLGVLVVIAAVTTDPDQAEGLDGAFQAIARVPFGEAVVILIGVGFIAYGVYSGFRARFARL
ncbi:DUF1206 domain-containing protein [Pseudolysinimonas sp.]|uniref:DUF1206 domain-containing protein n=1 Tax=Pseudolysinimonas sp. TaxID=2680009 RepID=UPI003F822ED2